MELTPKLIEIVKDAAEKLQGPERRTFIARVVRSMGRGGQSRAAEVFGWGRNTIRKGQHELETGIACLDGFSLRGAKPFEERLPNLRADLRDIVEGQSQTDPTFRTTQLYRRITAAEVWRQLRDVKGYAEADLPTEETVRTRLNEMGYRPMKVRKSKPKKRFQKRTRSSQT